jgi:hypothetical protein
MANTAASLDYLLDLNASISYYTQQQIFWSRKYEANHEILAQQEKYFAAYEKAVDNANDESRSSDLKMGNAVFIAKNTAAATQEIAEQWGHYKAPKYDEAYSEELAELDIEYDTMKTTYDTMLEELRAQQEAAKNMTSTNAQDTGLLNQ